MKNKIPSQDSISDPNNIFIPYDKNLIYPKKILIEFIDEKLNHEDVSKYFDPFGSEKQNKILLLDHNKLIVLAIRKITNDKKPFDNPKKCTFLEFIVIKKNNKVIMPFNYHSFNKQNDTHKIWSYSAMDEQGIDQIIKYTIKLSKKENLEFINNQEYLNMIFNRFASWVHFKS